MHNPRQSSVQVSVYVWQWRVVRWGKRRSKEEWNDDAEDEEEHLKETFLQP